jgi:beta-glucosidase
MRTPASLATQASQRGYRLNLIALALLAASAGAFAQDTASTASTNNKQTVPLDPWLAPNGTSLYQMTDAQRQQANQLAKKMVANLSFSQKVAYLGSDHFAAQPQFNLPALTTSEGTDSVASTVKPSIVYPSAASLSATWDPAMAAERGRQLALDAKLGGVQMVNGPGLNMYRTPYGGRQAEYLAGEDPILGAVLGTAYVEGQQSEGVMAELKHIVANDQESNRTAIDEDIDERTLHEMYLLPFEAVVKLAKPSGIMCGFTSVNGTYSCQNSAINQDLMVKKWGFDGFLQSDWGAIHDAGAAMKAGVAIDSSAGGAYSEDAIRAAIAAGQITEADLDARVTEVIRQVLYYKMGANVGTPATRDVVARPKGEAVATRMASDGMVLLKNKSSNLPLSSSVRSIAVLGAFADTPPARPVGSGWATYAHYVSELAGIQAAVPSGTRVDYITENTLDPATATLDESWQSYYFATPNWQGYPALMRTDDRINFDWSTSDEPGCATGSGSCGSAVWTNHLTPKVTGDYVFKVHGNGQMQVAINGTVVVRTNSTLATGSGQIGFAIPATVKVPLVAGQRYDITVTYNYESAWVSFLGGIDGARFSFASLTPATSLKNYDAVIVSGGLGSEYEGEGIDHEFALPDYQADLIANVAAVNPHTTAVIYSSSAVDVSPFKSKVASLLFAWYPGQNGGTALADVLFGKVNPSGKLPLTIDRQVADDAAAENFPMPINHHVVDGIFELPYNEGPYYGYRGYDRTGLEPSYAFGFGLSYTSFKYSNLRVTDGFVNGQPSVDVAFDVTNTGKVDGAEAAQVYVGAANPSVDRPVRELKAFDKKMIKVGATQHYVMHLPQRAFAYFVPKSAQWRVDAGAYDITAGASSADLTLHASYKFAKPINLSEKTSTPIFDPGFAK